MAKPTRNRSDDDGLMPWIAGFFLVLACTAMVGWGVVQYQLAQNFDTAPQTVGSIH